MGPACTDTVEPLAGVAREFSLTVISYGAEGAIFSTEDDAVKYPYFFRTIPENKYYVEVYYRLFEEIDWKRIASLFEDGQRYSEYVTHLEQFLRSQDGYSVNTLRYTRDETNKFKAETLLNALKNETWRIIIGDFYQNVARIFICKAYHMKMTGFQDYVWFLPHWYSKDWYDVNKPNTQNEMLNCTTEQMRQALQGHMSLSYKYFGENNQTMEEGITVEEWRRKYERELAKEDYEKYKSGNQIPKSDYAGFAYDAVWTYALALDKLFKESRSATANLRSKTAVR